MKKDLTELVFIIDRSGSMAGLESDTIGGFNAMLDKQKKAGGEALVSTVLFNQHSTVVHDRAALEHIPLMTEHDYQPGGCTALLDALGDAIHHIGNVHKYARAEDVPEKTIFVITTDGMENASQRYTANQIREKIERQKRKYGWEFLFLAANIDAVETARCYGIAEERAAAYTADHKGTRTHYAMISDALTHMRTSAEPLPSSWKRREED